jgi:hypothetical protein
MPIKIEHRVGIPVPPDLLWEILSDVSRWPEWTTIYPHAKGVVGFGEKLTLTLALPNQKPVAIAPRVFDWAPNEAIHWKLPLYGGLGGAIRYLEIETLAENSCIFSNGEILSGFATRWVQPAMRRSMRAGFTALGEAMEQRALALWRERAGQAT